MCVHPPKMRFRDTSDVQWDIVHYPLATRHEVCILENVWREQKDRLFRVHTTFILMHRLPLDVIRHMVGLIDAWRSVDAQCLPTPGTFRIELRRMRQPEKESSILRRQRCA